MHPMMSPEKMAPNASTVVLYAQDSENLFGYIPFEVGLLGSLKRLNLAGSDFSKPIPSRLFSATSLVPLKLSLNSLSGPIPTQIKNLRNLAHLDLSSISLSGSLPEALAKLRSLLGTLNLSYNEFIRRGTVWTASALIITALIGSGGPSLAWAIAQLGWIAGPTIMLLFAFVTYYTSTLLTTCYCSGDPATSNRNYAYMGAVRDNLGSFKIKLFELVLYVNLFGVAISYTIASSTSMMAIKKSNCFHEKGEEDPRHINSNPYKIAFGFVEIILSQIPNFDRLWWLWIGAAFMSFTYTIIELGLSIAKLAETGKIKGSLTGINIGALTSTQNIWRNFQALGDIAFAYSYFLILVEVQDTIRSSPSESKTTKKASLISIAATTLFYMICGCTGYAAFGDMAPKNLLTGFGFHNPYWMVDIANAAIVILLLCAYQFNCQPLFAYVEKTLDEKFPNSQFIERKIEIRIPGCSPYELKPFQLVWRTVFVIGTTFISMLLPFFNDIVGLLGALGFWPLTVFFPVEMYIKQKKIPKWSTEWVFLQIVSVACLIITIAAAAGSVADVFLDLKSFKPFSTDY